MIIRIKVKRKQTGFVHVRVPNSWGDTSMLQKFMEDTEERIKQYAKEELFPPDWDDDDYSIDDYKIVLPGDYAVDFDIEQDYEF